jgi:hypothetical protein
MDKYWVFWLDKSGSGWDMMEGSCGNGRSGSTESKEIMDKVTN